MGDHSRLALCAFMVGLIAFNPFSSFLGGFVSESASNDFSARVDQRKILSDNYSSKCAIFFGTFLLIGNIIIFSWLQHLMGLYL